MFKAGSSAHMAPEALGHVKGKELHAGGCMCESRKGRVGSVERKCENGLEFRRMRWEKSGYGSVEKVYIAMIAVDMLWLRGEKTTEAMDSAYESV